MAEEKRRDVGGGLVTVRRWMPQGKKPLEMAFKKEGSTIHSIFPGRKKATEYVQRRTRHKIGNLEGTHG